MKNFNACIYRLLVYYCSALNGAHKDLIEMMKEQLVLVSFICFILYFILLQAVKSVYVWNE